MSRVKLKICGITSLDDACAAVTSGADYLGFNFYGPSPRYIAPDIAREIIAKLPDRIISVGVFVNEPRPEDVLAIMAASGMTMAQLHGDEDADYCARVGPERVIKALRVGKDFDPQDVLRYPAAAVLLDAFDARLYGGTGTVADWEVAQKAAQLKRVFLAGGLGPENIAEAVTKVAPYAVDVNSGVEIAPGRKDKERLHRLKMELEK
jgi:phosphoribosylanthranilate isomerase